MFTGSVALPVSADAVMFPLAPRFTVATANAPVPCVARIFTMPSLVGVTTKATMSGTGVAEAERSSVFSPTLMGAGSVFVQSKLNCRSVGAKALGRDEGNDKTLKTTARNVNRCVGSAGDLIGVWVGRLVVKVSCQTA